MNGVRVRFIPFIPNVFKNAARRYYPPPLQDLIVILIITKAFLTVDGNASDGILLSILEMLVIVIVICKVTIKTKVIDIFNSSVCLAKTQK